MTSELDRWKTGTGRDRLARSRLVFELPSWLQDLNDQPLRLGATERRMRYVIDAAHRNVTEGTGGPFAAAIFDVSSGAVVSVGVNLVTRQRCSMLHAEVVAIMLAQRRHSHFDLSATGARLQLVTSCEPCAMCFGSIPWSGVRELVCGACDADARAIGFDEGPKLENWGEALTARGITVEEGVLRKEAAAVFTRYVALGGAIYNPSGTEQRGR